MMIDTFSIASPMSMLPSSPGDQMQPRGFGMPAIFAANLAGPFGKSSYNSLMGTPEVLPSKRTLGPAPLDSYSERMKRMTSQWRSLKGSIPSPPADRAD